MDGTVALTDRVAVQNKVPSFNAQEFLSKAITDLQGKGSMAKQRSKTPRMDPLSAKSASDIDFVVKNMGTVNKMVEGF